jgi:uncharacterized protein involved in exopolysaccharide biosynthesis
VHNSLPYSLNAENGLPVMIPPAMSVTLRDLAAPLFRRQRALIFMFLFVFAGVAVIGLSRWHKYEVHLAILVGHERVDPSLSAETPLPHEDVDAEVDLLRSRDLLQQVVLANRLQSIGQFWFDLLHPGQTQTERVTRAVQDLAAEIDLETPSGTNLIEVTYSSSDPALAFGVLNSLSTIFLEKHAQPQNDEAAMEDAEAGLRALARKPIVTASVPAWKQQSDLAPSRSPTRQDPQTAQQLLKKLAINLLNAETKRTQLLLKYEMNHPLVKEANQQIAAIKEAIAEGNRAKDEADLADQRASLAADQRSIESLKAHAGKARTQSLDEVALQREAQADERNYLQYLDQREQARVAHAPGKTRIGRVAIAVPPAKPVLPAHGPAFIVLIALASAALVSFPMAYILDYFDPSFHTPAQVLEILRVPVVVAVPKRTA